MPTETLEFEESLVPLLQGSGRAVGAAAHRRARARAGAAQSEAARRASGDLRKLTPWQRVLVARHPSRPDMLDYVARLFTDFVELHGDRRFADDHAIVAGTACYKGEPVMVVGHHKGGDTKQKIYQQLRLRASRGLSQGDPADAHWPRSSTGRSSSLSIRRRRTRASNRKSAAWPRRSPSTCARCRC